jgi:fructose-bisphosphate aldolase class 1
VHFKELFALDGKPSNISENDIQRRNAIAKLLEEWGLVTIINPQVMIDNIAPLHQIKIIAFKEKDEWSLIPKYNIGKKPQEY